MSPNNNTFPSSKSPCGSCAHSHIYLTITNSRVSRFAHDNKLPKQSHAWNVDTYQTTLQQPDTLADRVRLNVPTHFEQLKYVSDKHTHVVMDGIRNIKVSHPVSKRYPTYLSPMRYKRQNREVIIRKMAVIKWHDMSYLLVDTYLYFQYDWYSVLKGYETFNGECVWGFRTLKTVIA
jgi:hypothetical protein